MKHIITMTVLLCLQVATFAQITPSVYAGIGLSTNLGGKVGIGTEVQYKKFSANAAIGGSDFRGSKSVEYVGDNPVLGFDVGLKYYIYRGLFGGVNYGVLFKDHDTTETPNVMKVENRYGFSFTLGYKLPFNKSLYGMTYIGTTSEKDANHFFNAFLPVFGFIIGYNFISNEKL